jgi:DNA-directed RNA polymerase specialized sigma subunit
MLVTPSFAQAIRKQKQVKNEINLKKVETKIEKASKQLIIQFKNNIAEDKNIEKEFSFMFKTIIEKMESDKSYALKLTELIGKGKNKEINAMLTETVNMEMQIIYLDTHEPEIQRFAICANRNGVRHCFPSQRNSDICPKL